VLDDESFQAWRYTPFQGKPLYRLTVKKGSETLLRPFWEQGVGNVDAQRLPLGWIAFPGWDAADLWTPSPQSQESHHHKSGGLSVFNL